MESGTTTTLAPTTIADVVGIDAGEAYGDLISEGTGGQNGAINFAGMTGDGEEATTTVAPVVTDNADDASVPTGGTSKGEGEGDQFGFSIANPGMQEPEQPDCYWADWTEWDKCSETCGGGQRNRYRSPIGGTIGDQGCEGLNEEVIIIPNYNVTRKNNMFNTNTFRFNIVIRAIVRIKSVTTTISTYASWFTSPMEHQTSKWVAFESS